jgi:iron complex outermembrane receptor protein
MFRHHAHCGVSAAVLCGSALFIPTVLHAQSSSSLPAVTVEAPNARPSARPTRRPTQRTERSLRRRAPVAAPPQPSTAQVDGVGAGGRLGPPPLAARFQLPQQSFGISAKQIEETINLKDAEDAVKYFPSLFVRKRNDGDNQAVLATRSWGLNSSARTLIYFDDLLVSALIGNNNTGAAPRWNLITPEAIGRVDFLDGPFSAAYPGNSIGGVLLITSKMPDRPFATAKETISVMPWSQYGTKDTYVTSQTSAAAGDRNGPLSWLISANYLDSYQQPLTYVTSATIPGGTTGTYPALNKQGLPANIVGAGTLAHSQQTSGNVRLAYDVTPLVQATYAFSIWNNVQTSNPQTYLRSTTTGVSTFGGVAGFASGRYEWYQTHMSNALSLRSDTRSVFDFDLSISTFNYLQDTQISPYTVTTTGAGFSTNGRITRNDGTNWQNADAKAIWRPFGYDGPHEISFGLHGDRYRLENPVYASSIWNATSLTGTGQVYSIGTGETQTGAFWIQDAWKILSNLKLTVGGRLETWRARDGFNLNTTASASGVITSTKSINQPGQESTNFSPKATLSYDPAKDWTIAGSFGEAYRYPTVTELYQNISVGGLATFANPNLAPERDLNGQLLIERRWSDGRVRLTVFKERTDNAIISQTNLATNPSTGAQVPTTTIGNVGAVGFQGVELSADRDNVLISGVQVFGSVTYVDSKIISNPSYAGSDPLTGKPNTSVGKRVPYVPDWRAKAGVTYRPNERWAFTTAVRYSGKQYSTLDNTDIIPHVYGAFDRYIVVDVKLHYNATRNFSFDFGIDNVFDEKYFLFHPFPGRTYVMAAKYTF